jgi:hypothetical protein
MTDSSFTTDLTFSIRSTSCNALWRSFSGRDFTREQDLAVVTGDIDMDALAQVVPYAR